MYAVTKLIPCLSTWVAFPHPDYQVLSRGLLGKSLSTGLGTGLLCNSWLGHLGATCAHRLFRGLPSDRCCG